MSFKHSQAQHVIIFNNRIEDCVKIIKSLV